MITSRAVERETVTLGDDLLISPKKVHPIRSDLCLKFERWQRVREAKTQHLCLQHTFGLFGVDGPFLQQQSKCRDTRSPLSCMSEELPPGVRNCESTIDEKMFEYRGGEDGCPRAAVEKRAERSSHGNTLLHLNVEILDGEWTVQHRANQGFVTRSRRRHDVYWVEQGNRRSVKPRCGWSTGKGVVSSGDD